MSLFEKLINEFGEYLLDNSSQEYIYHVRSPHLLIQATGYLKYYYSINENASILFRGQSQLYDNHLQPSLFRNIKNISTASKNIGYLKNYLEECHHQCSVLKNIPKNAREPLLQHYGVKTSWIDVVDNIWVALWFACYKSVITGKNNEYMHFEKRNQRGNIDYAYILFLKNDNGFPGKNGFFKGKITERVDLRIATPSTFVRPHAQHALSLRMKGKSDKPTIDYYDLVVGVIRVDLDDALDWLGTGILLSTHVLFPSPYYDFGYRDLLNFLPKPKTKIGSIQHIGS